MMKQGGTNKMSINEKLAKLARKGKEAIDAAQTSVEGLVDKVQGQLDDKESVAGKVAGYLEAGVKKGQELHRNVQERGGYVLVTTHKIDDLADSLYIRIQRADKALFTNGEFDYEKALDVLGRGAESTAKYGTKAVKHLGHAAVIGKDKAKESFRNAFPSRTELETTYEGIGTEYSGLLFRKHFDDCLAFHAAAADKIPSQSKNKPHVLADIKASAAGDLDELVGYYTERVMEKPELTTRMSTAMTYLAK